ncbi:MAG: methyltransferase domain-containing protein [Gemmatimonadaceae bacterium]|nr:methyltransferase domain-containing protein [Gemmatimonadaceae bacterium]
MLIDRISSSLAFRLSSNKRKVARQWRKLRSASDSQGESKYSRFARELEACAGPLAGKRLLEIGSDTDGNLLRACIERGNLSSAVGVNPAITRNLEAGKIQMLGVDARSLPFPESSFDMAVSLSVFEHVFDLSAVLEKCHRVLKPGGVLYPEFGPIWSSSWGHHLWLYHGGEVVDWRTHPLPPYAHLLMTRDELEAWCNAQYGDADLSGKIVSFVFDSTEQNGSSSATMSMLSAAAVLKRFSSSESRTSHFLRGRRRSTTSRRSRD